jgi:hypothetical protein
MKHDPEATRIILAAQAKAAAYDKAHRIAKLPQVIERVAESGTKPSKPSRYSLEHKQAQMRKSEGRIVRRGRRLAKAGFRHGLTPKQIDATC